MPQAAKLAYSVNELILATSLSKATLWRMLKAGRLSSYKVGGRTLVTAQSVHAQFPQLGVSP